MWSLASSCCWPLLPFLVHLGWLFNWCNFLLLISHSQSLFSLFFTLLWKLGDTKWTLEKLVLEDLNSGVFFPLSKFWLILHCSLFLWSLICVIPDWVLIQFVVAEMEVNRALLVMKYGLFLVVRIRVLCLRNFMLQMIKREEVWVNY